ncbi:ABC transporter ATP-binding protein [Pseudomonas rustica]|uniref:ABC transporter ATP-binding protein n=1 Tax=Pseudomonas rustica TaxID=2827099 RepID=UPI001BAFC10C|nr:ABC transporter ATP-binding protein [Pseudomonas rustica]MBS4085814.1 ABC transporter ATP-binding protein [Pseudomonas rustica]
MSSDISIKVDNLSKCYHIYDKPSDRLLQMISPVRKQYYKEFWALRDLSFEIKRGESIGILGRNGSGKSTLLQMICGTLNPTTGSVQTFGRIAALLELGSGFNPDFTGRENIFLNGTILGLTHKEIEDRFDAIAAFADIGEHLDQPVKTYSSGMLVRLAFAVQVQVTPDILIVDEALAVGDALFQKRCFQQIEKLISDGTTLLFVSHDQESVRTLTHRALLLHKGVKQLWGKSSDVVLEYRRMLHEDERQSFLEYGAKLTANAAAAAATAAAEAEAASTAAEAVLATEKSNTKAPELKEKHNKLKSFGDLDAEILGVKILDAKGVEVSHFYIGERITIKVSLRANVDLDNVNVAFRIRNKEGVKITSWGTLNHDMRASAQNVGQSDLIWLKSFKAGAEFAVEFNATCTLGANLYEVQATVTREHDMFYGSQQILHWMDEAAFFTVAIKQQEYVVGGICDLGFDQKLIEHPL